LLANSTIRHATGACRLGGDIAKVADSFRIGHVDELTDNSLSGRDPQRLRDGINGCFYGPPRVARVRQFGETDRVAPRGATYKYSARGLLGLTEADRDILSKHSRSPEPGN
jgi:hypothetical protein